MSSATFLILCAYLGNSTVSAVVFLTISVGSTGLAMSGFNINHIDIAPKYAGVLMGMSNTFATIPGMVGPAIAKAIAAEVSVFMVW